MNKSIIKEMVQESIRNSIEPKQTNESLIASAAIGAISITTGLTIANLVANRMIFSKAKKVYDNHWHVIDKKFQKFVLKNVGVSDKDATTLMLAQLLSVDATALEMETETTMGIFDDTARFQMIVDEVSPIVARLKASRGLSVFSEDFQPPSNISKNFTSNGEYTFQHAALGFILTLIEDIERLVKTTPKPISPSFDKQQVAMYNQLKQAFKSKYF